MKINFPIFFFRQSAFALFAVLLFAAFANAQSSTFTFQGRLTDSAPSGNSYLFKFELFDQAEDGALIDTITDLPASVTNGVFKVELNFTAEDAFDGGERFLEISVKRNAGDSYTRLSSRQKISSAPYAIRASKATTADTATNVLNVGGTPANQIIREGDPRLIDTRDPRAGSGNYIQNQNSAPQPSTDFNISGTGTANTFNAETQFNIAGRRVFFAEQPSNTFTRGRTFSGINAGRDNTTGGFISFFGENAGASNTQGHHNAFFGSFSGNQNKTGFQNTYIGTDAGWFGEIGINNSFLGYAAGFLNNANDNTFIGSEAGYFNTDGTRNVFVGRSAGRGNISGSDNTFLGFNAGSTANNLTFAAAIGSGATVSANNTIVLGRSADTVRIPGSLNVAGSVTYDTFGANIVSAGTQFNIGTAKVLNAPAGNTFVGLDNGTSNSTGDRNAFFGSFAGTSNTAGGDNSFFGREAGNRNTEGDGNSFFGFAAGYSGTTGSRNTFIGWRAVTADMPGNDNTALGANTGIASGMSFATAVGAGATVSLSNSIVLGRSGGQDAVRIPGRLFVEIVPSGDRRNMQWDSDTGQLFQDTSSRRYKENIRPLAVDFRQVLKASPQTYTRPGFPGRWEIGFIAEDLDALGLKPLVEYDKEGRPDGVNYDKIPLYLTGIAAEQDGEIKRLTEENNRLKSRLDEQQSQLDALKKLVCAMQPAADICK